MSDPGFQNYIHSILKRNDTVELSQRFLQDDGTSRVSTATRTSRTSITSARTTLTGAGSRDETIHSFNLSITATIEPFPEHGLPENDGTPVSRKSSKLSLVSQDKFKDFVRKPTFYDRMSIKRNDSIEYLKTITKRPKILQPEPDLPIWSRIPLENKIPLLTAPPGSVTYSRGLVCQELVLGKKDGYQENSFESLEGETVDLTYNALHDPHAKGYILKPYVQKQLIDQGLITSQGKVLCNYQEFNKYRAYMSNLYSADLGTSLQMTYKNRADVRELKEQVEVGDVPEDKKKNVLRERKLAQAREKSQKIRKRQERRFQELVKMREDREKQILLEAEQRRLDMDIRKSQRNSMRGHRLQDHRLFFNTKRLNVYTALEQKEKHFLTRVSDQQDEIECQKEQRASNWLKKWDNYEDRAAQQDKMLEENRQRILTRADSRQSWHQRQWTATKDAHKSKRKITNRTSWLTMKYSHLWKSNVQKSRGTVSPSARLESRWNVRNDFEATVLDIKANYGPAFVTKSHDEIQPIEKSEIDPECTPTAVEGDVEDMISEPQRSTPMTAKKPKVTGRGEPELGGDNSDMTFILTGILNELNDRTVDMNLRIVARAVLKSLTDEARKQCLSICSEIKNQISEEIIDESEIPEDPSGDGQNVRANGENDLEIFQQDGNKPDGVSFELSQDILNSNAASGDWQMPTIQTAENTVKTDESDSCQSEIIPSLPDQNSQLNLVLDVKGQTESAGDSESLSTNDLDIKLEQDFFEIQATPSYTSFDSSIVERRQSSEDLLVEEEHDSDCSESDSSIISMEVSKETTEALRRDREGQMSFLRSRPSRVSTGLPSFVNDNNMEVNEAEKVEKYIANIMQEVKEFTESESVLDIKNHNSCSALPSIANLNKESDIVSPNSLFTSTASYMDLVSNFETKEEKAAESVEETKCDSREVKSPSNSFFKQLLEKGLRSTSTKNQDYILDNELPEPLAESVGTSLSRMKSLAKSKGENIKDKDELKLYVQRFFEIRNTKEIRQFLDRIQGMEDPNDIAELIKNERIKLDSDIQSFKDRKVKVKKETPREFYSNPIYRWLKPKSNIPKAKKGVRPKLTLPTDPSKKQQQRISLATKNIPGPNPTPKKNDPPTPTPTTEKCYEIRTLRKQKMFSQNKLSFGNQFSVTKSKRSEGYSKVIQLCTETNDVLPVLKPLPPLKKVRFENYNSATERAVKLREMSNLKIKADAAAAVNSRQSRSRPATANSTFRPVSILTNSNSRPSTPMRVISTATRTTEFSRQTSSGHRLFYKTSNRPTGGNVFRTDDHIIKSTSSYRLNSSFVRPTTANSQTPDNTRFHIDAMNRINPPFLPPQNQRLVLPTINVPNKKPATPLRPRTASAVTKLPPIVSRQPQEPICGARNMRGQNLTTMSNQTIEQKRTIAEKSRPQTPVPLNHDQIMNQHVLPLTRRKQFESPLKCEIKKLHSKAENIVLMTTPKIETKSIDTMTNPIEPEKISRTQPQVKPFVIHRRRVKNPKSGRATSKLVPSEETINETLRLLQTILFFRAVDEVKDSLKKHDTPEEFPPNLVKKLYQTSTTSLARMALMLSQAYVRRDKSKIGKILKEFEFGVHKLSTFVSALVISNVRKGQPLSTSSHNTR